MEGQLVPACTACQAAGKFPLGLGWQAAEAAWLREGGEGVTGQFWVEPQGLKVRLERPGLSMEPLKAEEGELGQGSRPQWA